LFCNRFSASGRSAEIILIAFLMPAFQAEVFFDVISLVLLIFAILFFVANVEQRLKSYLF
jgi:hypothetical protein